MIRIMSSITFDTLKYVDALASAGIPDAQARAGAQALRVALSEAINDSVVTRRDLVTEFAPVKADIVQLKTDAAVSKWMTGAVLAFVLAIFWKLFA
jgi:MoxR-like ATPase